MSDIRNEIFPGGSGPSRLRRIVLEFDSFRDFIQLFSPRVAEEGMFIDGGFLLDGPPPVGEKIDFEVRLKDDFRLVHGRGEVTWVEQTDAADNLAGVAVRFLDLDEPSRRLVSRLISNFLRDGGVPFELPVAKPETREQVEPEVLTRSEADQLFALEPSEAMDGQQEIDALVVPADEELAPQQEPGSIGTQIAEALPRQEELDAVVAGVDDVFLVQEEPAVAPDLDEALTVQEDSAAESPVEEVLSAPLETGAPAEEPTGDLLEPPEVPPVILDSGSLLSEEEAQAPPDSAGSAPMESLAEAAEPNAAVDTAASPKPPSADDGEPFELPSPPQAPVERPSGPAEWTSVADGEEDFTEAPSGPVIPDEIAQIAEQLAEPSVQQPVEMPTDEDRMAIAGAGRAKPTRRPWLTLAVASLAGTALGVAAWFFAGDQLKSWIGLGSPESDSAVVAPAPASAEAVSAETAGDVREMSDQDGQPAAADEVSAGPTRSDDRAEVRAVADAAEEQVPAASAAVADADEPQVVALDPATRIENISWTEQGGGTVLTIQLDGGVEDDSFEIVRIREGAPREVIKILGITELYQPKQLEVGTAQLERLRIGLHGSESQREIHIVADLGGAGITVKNARARGKRLVLTFS